MEAAKQYVMSVTACGILCGMILKLVPKNASRDLIKILCGMALVFTLIDPLEGLRGENLDLSNILENTSGKEYTSAGIYESRLSLEAIIRKQVEAYILEKAEEIEADIQVKVYLSGDEYPIPEAVVVQGEVSAQAKEKLEKILEKDLGIAKEFQTWKE